MSPNATQSFTLTVERSAGHHVGATAQPSRWGRHGTFTVTSTGYPTAALSETGSLPAGVTFTDNGDGTATLAGTPAAGTGGSYPITMTASQRGEPQRHPVLHPDRRLGAGHHLGQLPRPSRSGSAGTFSVTTTGRPTSALAETGTLPTGVSFVDNGNGTATLSGNPAAGTGGSYPITITATTG